MPAPSEHGLHATKVDHVLRRGLEVGKHHGKVHRLVGDWASRERSMVRHKHAPGDRRCHPRVCERGEACVGPDLACRVCCSRVGCRETKRLAELLRRTTAHTTGASARRLGAAAGGRASGSLPPLFPRPPPLPPPSRTRIMVDVSYCCEACQDRSIPDVHHDRRGLFDDVDGAGQVSIHGVAEGHAGLLLPRFPVNQIG